MAHDENNFDDAYILGFINIQQIGTVSHRMTINNILFWTQALYTTRITH